MVAEPILLRRPQWTYEQVSAIEDDTRRELHDGEIFEMPSPTLEHQNIVGRLYLFLSLWAQQYGGRAFLSPVDLYVEPRRYFIPDLCFYTAQSLENESVLRDPKRLTVAPDLIVEILSESTARNDRVVKVRAYAEFGVKNYWLIDPNAKTLEALELHDGQYTMAAALTDEETFAPTAFEGFSLELKNLFDLS